MMLGTTNNKYYSLNGSDMYQFRKHTLYVKAGYRYLFFCL